MRRYLLVWNDGSGALGDATRMLLRMNVDALLVASPDALRDALADPLRGARALAIAPDADLGALAAIRAEASARDASAPPPSLVVIGDRPAADRTNALRAAGVRHAVWSPRDASALRFVVNAALAFPEELAPRSEPRVPVDLLGAFDAHGVVRQAVVYTLSLRGAFLETPEPLPKGSSTRVTLWLPERVVTTRAIALHSNAREDQRAPRWPLGMSVLFGGLAPDAESDLRRLIECRMRQIAI